jgi:hypothetical protein
MPAVATKKASENALDPWILASDLAQACGVSLETLLAKCCPHGVGCTRWACDGLVPARESFPYRVATMLARQFGVCLIPPRPKVPTRKTDSFFRDVQMIGGQDA